MPLASLQRSRVGLQTTITIFFHFIDLADLARIPVSLSREIVKMILDKHRNCCQGQIEDEG